MSFITLVSLRISSILPHDFDRNFVRKMERNKSNLLSGQDNLEPEDPDYPFWLRVFYYFCKLSCLIDFISVMPNILISFVIFKKHGSPTAIRLLRLLRLVRVLKLTQNHSDGTHDSTVDLILQTMQNAFEALSAFSFFCLIVVVLFGTLIYIVECGTFTVTEDYSDGVYLVVSADGTRRIPTNFRSIPDSIYWAAITTATVGYGKLAVVNILPSYMLHQHG